MDKLYDELKKANEQVKYIQNEIKKHNKMLYDTCDHTWTRTFESYDSIEYYCCKCKNYKS